MVGKTLLLLFWLGLGGSAGESSAAVASAEIGDISVRDGFLDGAGWEDGKAEVSTYASQRVIYGKVREFETTMIVVKETLGKVSRVKQDSPHPMDPPIDGMKLNLVQRIETDNYPYHYLVNVLVDRANPFALIKQSVSSQEWCGTTFQQINHMGGAWKYWWDSYWQGEAHGFRILSGSPNSEESLLLALRCVDWSEGLSYEGVPVVWSMHKNRAVATDPIGSRITCIGVETVSSAAGAPACWKVQVKAVDKKEPRQATYWIGQSTPHFLVRYEGSEGRVLELKSSSRRTYW